ncbi:hypothetical protein [Salibacterium lacus]|uniref:Uncharacterized protein n=1 Tax=Salibacterium lacus TaxID=1898109 RepID=A0ABW5SYB5_9BACI
MTKLEDAIQHAFEFYGSRGALLQHHAERLAPYTGEMEALNDVSETELAREIYGISKGSDSMSGEGYGIIEDMAQEITQLKRRLRKVEAAQGYAEMGELSDQGTEKKGVFAPLSDKSASEAAEAYFAKLYEEGINRMQKSPQQRRDSVVERAKAEVERKVPVGGIVVTIRDEDGCRIEYNCDIDYVVDNEKRTVVALAKGVVTGRVYARGIAKCSPDDCFNSHIGRAIALRRALGLDVPAEYVNAPQPTEVREGDVLSGKRDICIAKETVSARDIMSGYTGVYSYYAKRSKIIDDSRDESGASP